MSVENLVSESAQYVLHVKASKEARNTKGATRLANAWVVSKKQKGGRNDASRLVPKAGLIDPKEVNWG